jgi:hypothetical protein
MDRRGDELRATEKELAETLRTAHEQHELLDVAEGYLAVLTREFTAQEGSFLLQLRHDLICHVCQKSYRSPLLATHERARTPLLRKSLCNANPG